MTKVIIRENLIVSTTVLCFFLLFLLSWIKSAGAWVFGLYSEVDGQYFAWLCKFLIEWGKPFDMNTLNPFQGMGSIFIPVNSWWNPAAFILELPNSKLVNFVLSYSIYWIEIFFATYFLAKTIGLNKIESILAAEIFVLCLFPPFSAYFNTIPYFSLVPMFAHWFAIMSMMTIAYIKLGEGGIAYNLFLLFFLVFASFIFTMSASFFVVTYIPMLALLCFGFTLHNLNRQHLLWKTGFIFFVASLFIIMQGHHYYKDTAGYVSASDGITKTISFSIPETWQKHMSIFYGAPPMFSYLHIFGLLGGLIGIFCSRGKYRWIACSFVLIALIPDVAQFLFENGIISGSVSQVNVSYYLWNAYPLFCIFTVILISFLWRSVIRVLHLPGSSSYFFTYLKLLIPLLIIPAFAMHIWFGTLSKNRARLKEPNKTPIVAYLQNQIGLNVSHNFRGTTIAYLASKNSPLRQLIGQPDEINDEATHFTMHHYTMSREFLNQRFNNRHMFSDLWNFSIPTLEEYGQWVSLPMYIYFKKMLAEEGDNFNHHFLNVYKLDLKVLRALGTRFIITDKILNEKGLSLVMTQKHPTPLGATGYVDYPVSLSAKKIFEELEKKFKYSNVSSANLLKEFNNQLYKIHPLMRQENEKMTSYLDSAIISSLGKNHDLENLSYADLEKIRNFFKIVIYAWMASPPLYLYEIQNPNLATFSPTDIIQVNSANELFLRMKKPDFHFEKSVIVQDSLPKNIITQLVMAKNSEMHFEKNAVQVKAESTGWSILLLPLQYSHCFRLTEMNKPSSDPKSVRLIRANLVQGALLFKGNMDVKLNFDFGIGRNTNCRRKDIQDMQYLGLINRT